MAKYVIPPINEPIMKPNGTMSLSWYLYLKQGGSGSGLPAQTGHAGEFLTTDGTEASWSDVDGYHPDLFDHKWADSILDDEQWLRADTFSWHNGGTDEPYEVAYQHLADDIDGKTLQSETIGSTTIQFYLADDEHKICPASEENNVVAIYNATGVAWYYIIDTANERFKLPRTKKPETNFVPDFSRQQEVSMPFTAPSDGWFVAHAVNTTTTVYVNDVSVAQGNWWSGSWSGNLNCQIIVKKGDIVTGATGTMRFIPFVEADYNNKNENKYLYFYIGQFTQAALENTAGLNAELFNGKVDTGHQVIAFQAPTALNNYTWYRKYADGWVEQGGIVGQTSPSATISISIPVEMADTNYMLTSGAVVGTNGSTDHQEAANEYISKSTTSFEKYMWQQWTSFWWKIEGMAA